MKTRLVALASILTVVVACVPTPTAAGEPYYVSTSGDDSADGLAEESAWRTIARAARSASAGDTVRIKAGRYDDEHVVIQNSGTKQAPIVFEGYAGTPVLDGQDRTGEAIVVKSGRHIELKNIEVTQYEWGVLLSHATHVALDDIVATNLGGHGYSGWGIRLESSHHCTLRSCSMTDARAVNLQLMYSDYNVIEDCTSYGIETENAVDYYIVIGFSHDNIIRNCTSHNRHPTVRVHPGHGIGIKDSYYKGQYRGTHSHSNRIIGCVARGHGENFFAAHPVHHNEFVGCAAYHDECYSDWTKAFRARDGAHHNTFRDCRAVGTAWGAYFDRTSESPSVAVQRDNAFLNCVFEGMTRCGVYFNSTENNVFVNCVLAGSPAVFAVRELNRGNVVVNSIVTDVPAYGLSWQVRHPDSSVERYSPNPTPDPDVGDDVTVTYSDFWNTDFDQPAGRGNRSNDPLFVAPTEGDYHLRSGAGRWEARKGGFVLDTVASPCIDAGDPETEWSAEPAPNGARVNIGAYGNTTEASKSASATPPHNGG